MAHPTESPYFRLRQAGDVAVFEVQVRELRQPSAAQDFGAAVQQAIDAGTTRKVLLDLSDTEYLCSTAFAVLFGLGKSLQEAGGALRLCGLHRDVQIGANIIGLGRYVPCFDTEHAALADF